MRNRGAIILKVKDKIALIRRCREGTAYYVFPGGGIEKAETPEQTAKWEAFEELGVNVEVKDCLAVISFNGIQYFFLGDIIEGVLGTGNGEEYNDSERGYLKSNQLKEIGAKKSRTYFVPHHKNRAKAIIEEKLPSTAFHFDEAFTHIKTLFTIIPNEKSTALTVFNHMIAKIGSSHNSAKLSASKPYVAAKRLLATSVLKSFLSSSVIFL
ncbi:NUDIX domain-containing protein [Peribacillus muralis]|uniref:NUDIX domain-containing protein n=1 Tax=Peribacillus muralis TaxID=264697 RepID=UPI0036722E89